MSETLWRGLAYALAAGGAGLAMVGAVQPHYDAGYHLHGNALVWGLVPYAGYVALTGFLARAGLVVPGLLLLGGDLLLRTLAAGSPPWAQALLLTLVVLPVGVGLGRLLGPGPGREPSAG